MKYEIRFACISNIGKVREKNQDNFICMGTYLQSKNNGTLQMLHGLTDLSYPRLFGVFDGMGGEFDGEMAAYLASKRAASIEAINRNPTEVLLDFCKDANRDICFYADSNGISSMGTTAAMLLMNIEQIGLCNIGDSKIYRLSENDFVQLSEDHYGIAIFGQKPPLSQNLGIPEDELELVPHTDVLTYLTADKYLICSDGLSDMVSTNQIHKILKDFQVEDAVSKLMDQALENGGKDNITIIAIEIVSRRSWFSRIFRK